MKKIIVPVDFSSTAYNAAVFAGNLAIFYGAELLLYHAYNLPLVMAENAFPIVDVREMQKAADHDLDLLAQKLQAGLRTQITIATQSEAGDLVNGLSSLCDAVQPDLIVMGISGKDALTKLLIGSNTIRVIHQIGYPVLVVPPKAGFTPVLRMGLACDYKNISETTPVALLKKMVNDFSATLHVVTVDDGETEFSDETISEAFLVNRLFNEVNPVYASVAASDVTQALNAYAAHHRLDWLVMIPKKHTLLQKIFTRSHADEMLYHTHLPVLCMHL
jgi:nucleotide-binding universal stress UspA family protein